MKNVKIKDLDISLVQLEDVLFVWLSPLCEANQVENLIITEEQSRYIFKSGEEKWTHYRGCLLKIKND